MIIQKSIDLTKSVPHLTEEQIEMLDRMEHSPINTDDIPEFTDEELSQFRRVSSRRHGARN